MVRETKFFWRFIWTLQVPAKLKHFIWKCSRNFLAFKCNLQLRGFRIDPMCPCCFVQDEMVVHPFFQCDFVRVFWFAGPLQLDVDLIQGDDFLTCWSSLYLKKYNTTPDCFDIMSFVAFGLRRLWKCRNERVFKEVAINPVQALQQLNTQCGEFLKATVNEYQQPTVRDQSMVANGIPLSWLRPPDSFLKINCDRAWAARSKKGGLGWVVRDWYGWYLWSGAEGEFLCASALGAKVEAIRVGLAAGFQCGWQSIFLEYDSKNND